MAGGRYVGVRGDIDAAARDAARAASLERDRGAATAAAADAATVPSTGSTQCGTPRIGGDFVAGGPATVRLDCSVPYDGLGLLGLGGSVGVSASGPAPRSTPTGAPDEAAARRARSRHVFVIGFAIVLLSRRPGHRRRAGDQRADAGRRRRRAGGPGRCRRIDLDALRNTGRCAIEPGLAQSAATDYLSDLGYGTGQYDVTVAGNSVDVTVRDRVATALLELVNISNFDVQAFATASPLTGPN